MLGWTAAATDRAAPGFADAGAEAGCAGASAETGFAGAGVGVGAGFAGVCVGVEVPVGSDDGVGTVRGTDVGAAPFTARAGCHGVRCPPEVLLCCERGSEMLG